jgi:hypothetical protein
MRVAEKLDLNGLKSVSLNLLESSGPVKACNGIDLPFYCIKMFQDLLRFATTRFPANSRHVTNTYHHDTLKEKE